MNSLLLQMLSGVTDTTSSASISSEFLFAASVQAVVTGTSPVGTLALEASNDILTTGTSTPQNWSTIATVAISAAGVFLIPKTDLCYAHTRVTFTKTSGTVSVSANLKALGS